MRSSTLVEPPLGSADDVAVGPDGTIAWTAGAFSAVHALTPDGEIKVLADGLPAVNSINYSPDGRLFVTQIFGGDALWEIDPQGDGRTAAYCQAPRRTERFRGYGRSSALWSVVPEGQDRAGWTWHPAR